MLLDDIRFAKCSIQFASTRLELSRELVRPSLKPGEVRSAKVKVFVHKTGLAVDKYLLQTAEGLLELEQQLLKKRAAPAPAQADGGQELSSRVDALFSCVDSHTSSSSIALGPFGAELVATHTTSEAGLVHVKSFLRSIKHGEELLPYRTIPSTHTLLLQVLAGPNYYHLHVVPGVRTETGRGCWGYSLAGSGGMGIQVLRGMFPSAHVDAWLFQRRCIRLVLPDKLVLSQFGSRVKQGQFPASVMVDVVQLQSPAAGIIKGVGDSSRASGSSAALLGVCRQLPGEIVLISEHHYQLRVSTANKHEGDDTNK